MTSAPAIGFEYRPSRCLPGLLTAVALLALVAIGLCGLSLWLKGLGVLLATILYGYGLRSATCSPVRAAGWSAEGGWSLRLVDGADRSARLASFRQLGAFVLLRLALDAGGSTVLLLAPDNSDADIRRRLRMRLAAAGGGQAERQR